MVNVYRWIYHTLSKLSRPLHFKWWFSKGIPPKSPKNAGLGFIVICPGIHGLFGNMPKSLPSTLRRCTWIVSPGESRCLDPRVRFTGGIFANLYFYRWFPTNPDVNHVWFSSQILWMFPGAFLFWGKMFTMTISLIATSRYKSQKLAKRNREIPRLAKLSISTGDFRISEPSICWLDAQVLRVFCKPSSKPTVNSGRSGSVIRDTARSSCLPPAENSLRKNLPLFFPSAKKRARKTHPVLF